MSSYMQAGDFTFMQRLRTALRANATIYISLGLIFGGLLIYITVRNRLDGCVASRLITGQSLMLFSSCCSLPRLFHRGRWSNVPFSPSLPTHSNGVMQVISGASNTWGLIMVILMLGYGVVDVPRFLWRRCQLKQSLRRQQFQVASINQELVEAQSKVRSREISENDAL